MPRRRSTAHFSYVGDSLENLQWEVNWRLAVVLHSPPQDFADSTHDLISAPARLAKDQYSSLIRKNVAMIRYKL